MDAAERVPTEPWAIEVEFSVGPRSIAAELQGIEILKVVKW